MSLDNVQLPASTIQQLYRNSLISGETTAEEKKSSIQMLGCNNRKTVLLVNSTKATYLPASQFNFLMEILSACRLTLDDIGLINLMNSGPLDYKKIIEELSPKTILLFGIPYSSIELPFNIPDFQLQAFDGTTYISVPPIETIQVSKELKRNLWGCLKQIFSL